MASTFSTNVAGKIKEIKLESKKGYQALFEVISNAIYSITHSLSNISDGAIEVTIERNYVQQMDVQLSKEELSKRAPVKNIIVTDNGEGFTEANFKSFLTCYSEQKLKEGGKGIGRFTCLKVFDYVSVSSVFGEDELFLRRFDFYPKNELENETLEKTQAPRTTSITLHNIKNAYADYFPTDLTHLADLIIEHFFINCVTGTLPKIFLNDQINGRLCVNDHYGNSVKHEVQIENFSIYDETFTIYHVISSLVKYSNKAYLCADNRTTSPQIDLRKYIQNLQSNISSEDGEKKWYFAYVTSNYFNNIVNSERTELVFPSEDKHGVGVTDIKLETFIDYLAKAIFIHLKKELVDMEKEKKKRIDNYINTKAPKYRKLRTYRPNFYRNNPNDINDKNLEMELYKEQQKWELEIAKQGCELFEHSKRYNADQIEELKLKYLDGVTAIGQSCLAEYIAKRKAILDIFSNALSQDPKTQRYSLEEVVHKLICPMISTSDELDYDDMSLWLIDERLAYHYYLASDKTLKSQAPIENSSTKETDLAIYQASLVFNDTDMNVPFNALTIVEFKRPMRDDYDEKENPITQVLDYIVLLRAGKAKTRTGRPISGYMESIPIYVYIIADLTESLTKLCDSRDFIATPDREGYFRYHDKYKAYIEILSYNKLYTNASQRNRVLFEKLFKPSGS